MFAFSIPILIGAVQGLFLSGFFLTNPGNKKADRWLGLLLAAISLHLVEYALTLMGVIMEYPAFIAITFPILFCIGPFYFLYANSLLNSSYRLSPRLLIHFIPAIVVLALMTPFYLMPATSKLKWLNDSFGGDALKLPIEQLMFMGVHVVQTSLYVYASYLVVRKAKDSLPNFSSDVSALKRLKWLTSFNLFLTIYFVMYFLVVAILAYTNTYIVELDYALLLFTSLSIYILGYSALRNPVLFDEVKVVTIENNGNKNPQQSPDLQSKLLTFMTHQKPFLKNDLRLSDLADSIGVSSHELSQHINREFKMNFYDFINGYRVEEAKKLLRQNPANPKMLAVAFDVGFNSKATFNRVFKKLTGQTPSEFKDSPTA